MSTCATCQKSFFKSYSQTVTVAASGVVPFNTDVIDCGSAIIHTAGSGTIKITSPGMYLIAVTGTGSATTSTDSFELQLYNNGTPVTAATSAVEDSGTGTFTTLLKVMPSCRMVDNSATLSVTNTGSAAVFDTIEIDILKVS